MALLDQLIECYGTEAVISVDPYMPDTSGEILRWVMMIDWKEVPEADIRVSEREGRSVMLLTDGHEQIELAGGVEAPAAPTASRRGSWTHSAPSSGEPRGTDPRSQTGGSRATHGATHLSRSERLERTERRSTMRVRDRTDRPGSHSKTGGCRFESCRPCCHQHNEIPLPMA